PIAGTLALVVGSILTISSFRESKNTQSNNSNSTQSLASSTITQSSIVPSNIDVLNKNQKASSNSNKSIEIAQTNSNSQPVNRENFDEHTEDITRHKDKTSVTHNKVLYENAKTSSIYETDF